MDENLSYVRKRWAFEAGFILYGLVVFLLAFITNTSIAKFFFATLPILISLIALVVLIEYNLTEMGFLLSIPLVLCLGFYGIWKTNVIEILQSVDGAAMTFIDLFATYIIYVIIFFLWGEERKKKKDVNLKKVMEEIKEIKVEDREKISEINKEAEYYKSLAQEYLKDLSANQEEKEYYRNILENYYAYVEANKSEAAKLRKISEGYSESIQKYIRELVKQIKQINRDKDNVKGEQLDKQRTKYMERLTMLNNRLKDAEQALKVTRENFTVTLRSIEDKCKAINFVIGRVYSDKNGGNEKIRELLNIKSILYNAFSMMTSKFERKHAEHFKMVLSVLQRKLSLFYLPERTLFHVHANSKLKRNKDGNDTVIEVLSKNDSDPIKEYLAEAGEICTNLIKYMDENY